MPLITAYIFIFLLGACVGSFLNVVIYRLPAGLSLVHPPSRCPKCEKRLAWYDNIPILGWIKLHGKCRYCGLPISPRYPIIELATALLFLGYGVAVFSFGMGPCPVATGGPLVLLSGLPAAPPMPDIERDWPLLVLHLSLLSCLLAASMIDLDTFTIPAKLLFFAALVGVLGHTFLMTPKVTGNLLIAPVLALPTLVAVGGYLLSLLLLKFRLIPLSFPEGEPMMLDLETWQAEIDAAKAEGRDPTVPLTPPIEWTRGLLNREMFKELAFILPPLAGFVLTLILVGRLPAAHNLSIHLANLPYLPGFLGSALGALLGGAFIWSFRIGGTFVFGKLAMGLGDIHLMAAVGAVTGGTVATLAVFPAAFWGLAFALYGYFTRSQREIPFGPYLALGTATVLLFSCPVTEYLLSIIP